MRFWVEGALVDAHAARVPVLDHGFTVGDGVFETCKIVASPDRGLVPFALDRHVRRLARSAAGLGIAWPGDSVVSEAMLAVCAENPELAGGGRLRVTLTSGSGPLGSDRGGAPVTLAVAAAPTTTWPSTSRLAISPWPRNERGPLAGLKSTSYAENVLMLAHAKRLGADEALLGNLAGNVCEGTGSNVFVVRDGTILTPELSSGCLAGITRELTIEACLRVGLPVREADVALTDLPQADEIFVTSSTRDIHPVAEVLDSEGHRVWAGEPGECTRAAAAAFADAARTSWNP